MRARAKTSHGTARRQRPVAVVVAIAMIAASLSLVLGTTAGTAEAARLPGELVRYDFTEGVGTTVADSGSGLPLDLVISDPAAVTWVAEGLQVNSSVSIAAADSSKIASAVAATNEFTVEAWVTPAAIGDQSGPARIVSSSASPTERNFMLGQGAFSNLPDDVFAARTRTSSAVSGQPNLFTSTGQAAPVLTHVVLTRDTAGVRTIYVDGAELASDTLGGDLSNWDASYPFVVGNVGTSDRPWLGTFCLVAMYDLALTPGDVTANYAEGCGTPNNAPVLVPLGAQAHDEGQNVAIPVVASDLDLDSLTFSATGLPDGLSIANVDATSAMISGTITQTAAAGSVYMTEVTVADGSGGSDTETIAWTVNAINIDPVLDPIGDQASGEGQSVSLPVAAFDIDGDVLQFSATDLPPALSIDTGTGVISGSVDPGAASYVSTVTVSDGNGGSASETFTWDVIGNTDPVLDLVGDQSNDEGDTVTLIATANDGDGDPLSFAATGLPDGLSMATSGAITGSITQTAAAGSVYSTVITVNDDKGGTASETLSWTVTAVNVDPTLAALGDQITPEGSDVSVVLVASDDDGDTLTFSSTPLPAGLTIDANTGEISGTATAVATTAVTITVDDGNGGTASTSLSWTVTATPSGPSPLLRYEFNEGAGTTVADTGSGTPVDLTISDASAVTWTTDGLSVDAPVEISTGDSTKIVDAVAVTNEFTVEAWLTPAAGEQDGPARIVSSSSGPLARNFMLGQGAWGSFPDDVYGARSRTSSSSSGTPQLFTSTGVTAPVLTHVVLTRDDTGARTVYVDGAVAGADTLSGNLGNWDASFDLVIANVGGGGRPWIGELCEVAIYDAALTAAEVAANFATPCGTPSTPNNDPTLDAIGDQSSDEGDNVLLTVSGADIDGDVLTFNANNLPDGLALSPVDASSASISGTISQTAAAGSVYTTEITVNDGNGGAAVETISWTVGAINVDPTLDAIGDQTSGEGAVISLAITAADLDGDTLTFVASDLPASLAINSVTGEISGTLDLGPAIYVTTVTIDDGNGGSASEQFTWNVIGNEAPVLGSVGDQTNNEGDLVNLAVSANDNDGDPLTFSATGLPGGLSIDAGGAITGTITQTAATGSIYSTEITVDDGNGGVDSETIQWTVNAVNVNPQLDPILDQTDALGSPASLTVTAADEDGDALTFSADILPDGLTIDASTGVISGTPTTAGSTLVTISVDDLNGGLDSTSFQWTVNVVSGPAPLVRYEFTEGTGTIVGDSGVGSPLDLTISDPSAVAWVPGRGLEVNTSVTIGSAESTKIADAVDISDELTVEAWISPAPIGDQTGPARIVSSSLNSASRNLMLGQGAFSGLDDDVFSARTRTSSSAGGTPTLLTTSGLGHGDPQLTHVVLTRDASGERNLYVDGVLSPDGTDTLGGNLGTWDGAYPLVLGNNGSGDRPWLGTFCEVAIYDSALNAAEVTERFTNGCTLPAGAPQALIQVTPGTGITSSTFGDATITISNTGAAEAPSITNVFFDIRGSLIPDATFDPVGTAGDEVQQCLDVSVEGGTGFIAPANPCIDPFSLPHEDDPGIPANGHDGMELNFNDFDTGESIVFGVDIDPTSIQGVPGAGGAGSVSGLELAGSTVVVTFSDNSSLTGTIFGDGSDGGGQAVVSTTTGQVAPTSIEMLGVTTGPSVFANNSQVGSVPATGDQTVRVSGPEGASVTLLAVTGALASPAPFDLDLYESDTAAAVEYLTGTIVGGAVDFTVSQPSATERYHYVATIDDGATGPASTHLVIGIGDFDTPALAPIDNIGVLEGDAVSVPLTASDPGNDPLTLSLGSSPDIEALGAVLTDNGDGTGSIDWVTESGDAGLYTLDVTVSDGNLSATQSFVIAVGGPDGPPALVRYEFEEGSGTAVADTGSGTALDLTIGDPAAISWVTGGLQINSPVVIASAESAKIADAVALSNEFSVEAWIRPDASEQTGPARIVSNAPNALSRNFMLGQGAFSSLPDDVFSARTLTTTGGSSSTLFTNTGNAGPSLQHVVLTRDASGVRTIYVNGVASGSDTVAGDLSNWDPTNPLVVGNVGSGARPWIGTVCEVSVYDSALSGADIAGNFARGCDIAGPGGAALVQITPDGTLGATTFGNATVTVSNAGIAGSPSIANVVIDVRGSIIPDATFDPIGTAGDEGTQCLAVSSEGGTGFIAPVDPCTDPFSLPHEDDPGVPANGWDAMELNFNNFDIGESIVFGVDVDPTSIQGVPGAGGSGAVSGLELTGSRVIVTFSDGSSVMSQIFGDGTDGGGQSFVSSSNNGPAPTIEMVGVLTSPTVFPNDSVAGLVGAAGPQTVRVSGPDGATVNLLAVTGQVGSPAPFDLDPFESDTATAVVYQTGIIAGGFVDFTVAQTDETKLYHYVATFENGGNTGSTSTQLVIGFGDVDTPVLQPFSNVVVNEGDSVAVAIDSADPNGDTITLGFTSTPDIAAAGAVLTDNGDGTGSLDWGTAAGDAGNYTVDVAASDGVNTAMESFTITVVDPNAAALYRVNSGGPLVAATDGGIDWSADQVALAANAGGTAATGTPSPYWISGEEKAYGTADAISLADQSVPAGIPMALFQTERYDPSAGTELVYEFPISSGASYVVDLYFAEIFATANDIREFAVEIEGTPVLGNYDIHELVGHDAGIVGSFVTPVVADDALTITFIHQVENPKVNAIEVRTAGPPPTDVPPQIGLISDQNMVVGGSLPIPITTFEPDGDVVSLSVSSTPDASLFTTFVDAGDGTGSATFTPIAGDAGVYTVTVTATDIHGSDTESFVLAVNDPPAGGTVFARINSAGPLVAAIDGGPDWEADANPGHPFLNVAGSSGNAGFPAVEAGSSVPATVPGAIFDTERWSTSGFSYAVPVTAGTQVFVRLFLGNGFPGTSAAGARVFDISIDGTLVQNDFDMVAAYGNEVGGMLEYLVTSDGTVDISFANVVENPLVNGIEVVSAASSPDVLGATPNPYDFGITAVNGSQSQTITLSNLGFDAGDPSITVSSVAVSGGDFTTAFVGPVGLGASGSTSFDLVFAPTTLTPQAETITIVHTGTNSPLVINIAGAGSSDVPVSYDPSGLGGENLGNPTSLDFGPDDRLYVVQQNANIKAYTMVRNGPNDYDVTSTETINLVTNNTPNHNDDGAANSTQQRQSTGLVATGTATNPVLYVSSSDWRIGGGGGGGDTNLDTNSGVISRLTWNGSSWDKVDIVRGLPRSEENHASNGMALDAATNTLYLMQGGHANKGAPSNNFSGTPEYFLSAAMLSIDLDAIEALPVLNDGTTDYVYNLPTLDDPNRPNTDGVNRIDIGDPFGGGNGANQAIPEPGGPVQIYAPGFRNAFDVVLTENGRLYTSDNGPNTGWGGIPLIDGNGECTNEFNEAGSNGHGDSLHFVSGPGYYGGHPTPIRAHPDTSGIYVYENNGGWSQQAFYNFGDLLPTGLSLADFPDNPVECEYSSDNPSKYVDIINSSTNGIAEYTASNFGGSMQGDILTASFNGNINRYKLNAAGDAFVLKEVLFSNFGSQPLDLVAQGDDDPFPGSIWAVTYGSNNVTVFEPQDFGTCSGADDDLIDEDLDGFSNGDEIDNGTNPCSAASQPADADNDNVSDLNDDDDDNDGILDLDDEFAIDPDNGTTTDLPVLRPFDNFNPGTGFFGLGLTGLMTNGTTDYLDQFDEGTLDAGGATGKLGVTEVTGGDAYQGVNTQLNAFQYGINVDSSTAPFVVSSVVESPFFSGLTPVNFQSAGIFMGPGDQDNYLKVVLNANGGNGGIEVLLETTGTATGSQYGIADYGVDVLTASDVGLLLVVDPASATVQPQVSVDGATPVNLGTPITVPASWFDVGNTQGLAVGVISTSTGGGAPVFSAVWDFLNVEFVGGGANVPPTIDPIADPSVAEEAGLSVDVIADDLDGDILSFALTGDVPAGMSIDSAGQITFTPDLDDSGTYAVTVEVSDGTNPAVTESFTLTVTQTDSGTVLTRINAGGPLVAATDGGPDWAANPNPNTLPELVEGGESVYSGNAPGITDISDPSVPAGTPIEVFNVERFDPNSGNMAWNFPMPAGTQIELRLGQGEIFNASTAAVGFRSYDIAIDGVVVDAGVDAIALAGNEKGFVTDYLVTVDADGLDIEFIRGVENPAVKSIEIIELGAAPNVAPTIDSVVPASPVTVTQGAAMAPIVVTASDSNGDPITLSTNGAEPTGVVFTDLADGSGEFTGTPTAAPGTYTVTVTAADSEPLSSSATVDIVVTTNAPPTIDPISDQSIAEEDVLSVAVVANDVDADPLTYSMSGDVPDGMTISAAGVVDLPATDLDDSGRYVITVEVNDGVNAVVAADFTLDISQTDVGTVLARVNNGGALVASTDLGPDWAVDTNAAPAPQRVGLGGGNVFSANSPITDISGPSVPAGTPLATFNTERWDPPTNPEMIWNFPVNAGDLIEVRIGHGEIFNSASAVAGSRVYDIEIDGVVVDTGIDPIAGRNAGEGFVTDYVVTADADGLDIVFLHTPANNPNPKSIEIIQLVGTNVPPTIDPIADQSIDEVSPLTVAVTAADTDGDTLTFSLSGDVPAGMTIDTGGVINFTPDLVSSGRYVIAVDVEDGVNPAVSESFVLDVTQAATPGSAIHRINVGGALTPAANASYPDWAEDTAGNPSPYYAGGGGGFFGAGVGISDITHPTVPGSVAQAVFESERYGPTTWSIPVDAGTEIEVRLYWAEVFSGITAAGQRVFDVQIDGAVVETGVDPFAEVGAGVGLVSDYLITSDGSVDIALIANVQSPALKGIEILGVSGLRSVALTSPVDGATINTDSVLLEWDLHGFMDDNDHVHVIIDGILPHTSIFRPETELLFENLADGPHTVTLQVADVTHTVYPNAEAFQTVTFTVANATPPVTRINAGGGEVAAAAGDTGPVWQADTPHPTLTSSASTTGGFPTVAADSSLAPYADIEALFTSERYDGTNAGAPVMSYSIPVEAGALVEVNLFFQNGWNGTQNPGTRQFDVYIEGGLVLDDFDLAATYGHQTRGMETFSISDDGDGVILIEFVHGPVENPLINAIEVVQTPLS